MLRLLSGNTGVGFPGGSVVKNLHANAEGAGSIPWLGKSPGGGTGNPLQYSSREIPWTEEPGGLQSMGLQRTQASTHEHNNTPAGCCCCC